MKPDEKQLAFDFMLEKSPEEVTEESLDGVSRVQELENALSDLLDLWDEGYIGGGDRDNGEPCIIVTQRFETAAAVLAGKPEED